MGKGRLKECSETPKNSLGFQDHVLNILDDANVIQGESQQVDRCRRTCDAANGGVHSNKRYCPKQPFLGSSLHPVD